jgi:hypothetical protein
MKESKAGMIPIAVILPRLISKLIIIVLAFYLLGTTADGYLAPSLEQIAKKLHFSEQLAISFSFSFSLSSFLSNSFLNFQRRHLSRFGKWSSRCNRRNECFRLGRRRSWACSGSANRCRVVCVWYCLCCGHTLSEEVNSDQSESVF